MKVNTFLADINRALRSWGFIVGNTKDNNSKKRSNLYFFIVLITVVTSLILIRVFLIGWISVSGKSMLPTLQPGELLLVDKTKHAGDDLQYGRHCNYKTS